MENWPRRYWRLREIKSVDNYSVWWCWSGNVSLRLFFFCCNYCAELTQRGPNQCDNKWWAVAAQKWRPVTWSECLVSRKGGRGEEKEDVEESWGDAAKNSHCFRQLNINRKCLSVRTIFVRILIRLQTWKNTAPLLCKFQLNSNQNCCYAFDWIERVLEYLIRLIVLVIDVFLNEKHDIRSWCGVFFCDVLMLFDIGWHLAGKRAVMLLLSLLLFFR